MRINQRIVAGDSNQGFHWRHAQHYFDFLRTRGANLNHLGNRGHALVVDVDSIDPERQAFRHGVAFRIGIERPPVLIYAAAQLDRSLYRQTHGIAHGDAQLACFGLGKESGGKK